MQKSLKCYFNKKNALPGQEQVTMYSAENKTNFSSAFIKLSLSYPEYIKILGCVNKISSNLVCLQSYATDCLFLYLPCVTSEGGKKLHSEE